MRACNAVGFIPPLLRLPCHRSWTKQFADVPLETADTTCVTHMLALRPAAQGCELAPTSRPATVPQAPFWAIQTANRLVGCARAEATSRLQRVLEAQRGMMEN